MKCHNFDIRMDNVKVEQFSTWVESATKETDNIIIANGIDNGNLEK